MYALLTLDMIALIIGICFVFAFTFLIGRRRLCGKRIATSALMPSLILATLAGCETPEDLSEADMVPPNIIFILVDDMGWMDLGYQGSEIGTPNIDQLAASGLKLNRAYAFPICSPTRAALMTGMNPLEYGVDGPMENDAQLSADLTLMPEYLKRAGYDTWLVGKWHLGMGDVKAMPHNRGFDHFYGHLGGFVDFYTHVYFGGLDWQRNGASIREEGYTTDLLTNEAIALIESRNPDAPFFMYLSYNSPHTPLQYPPEPSRDYAEIEDADRRVYAQMMTDLDGHIGRVNAALGAQGIQENTLIIFMSDNGGNTEAGASNGVLRGSKGRALEGGVRVPAFMVWPAEIAPGGVSDRPVFVQDWLPTLLQVANGEDSTSFDGHNVWDELVDASADETSRAVILGTANEKAVYDWPYKLVKASNSEAAPALYDIVADPTEETDLAAQQPDVVERLLVQIEDLPVSESKAARGPPPESLFRGEDGEFIHDIRKPETREPWAESAIGSQSSP